MGHDGYQDVEQIHISAIRLAKMASLHFVNGAPRREEWLNMSDDVRVEFSSGSVSTLYSHQPSIQPIIRLGDVIKVGVILKKCDNGKCEMRYRCQWQICSRGLPYPF